MAATVTHCILRVAVSPIHKYRSELSLYFYSLWDCALIGQLSGVL